MLVWQDFNLSVLKIGRYQSKQTTIPSVVELVTGVTCKARLHQMSVSTLRHCCSDTGVIENNAVAPKWVSMRTVSLALSQCYYSVDADASCKGTLNTVIEIDTAKRAIIEEYL